MKKRFSDEAIKTMMQTIQNDISSGEIDGGDVWQYIIDNTNLIELSKNEGQNPKMAVALSAFLAGIKWSLECFRIADEDLVDAEDMVDDE